MKVGIVHKLSALCAQLERALEVSHHHVVWTAHDAASAARELLAQRTDVVLWSVEIPGASRIAQGERPQIVVMYSRDQELAAVDEALAAGAATALNISRPERRDELAAKLETVRRLIGRSAPPGVKRTPVPLVAVGASTGGPQALARVCAALPATFAGALVVVQHMEAEFLPELATTLAARTALSVALAAEGSAPERGTLRIAAQPDMHLVLDAHQRFRYVPDPVAAIHRPSVDVLFESLARHWPGRGTAVLLTGMGRDGAHGMGLLRRAGWRTIAQDASSSAVYGMPRAAVDQGAANEVLSIADIGPALLRRERS